VKFENLRGEGKKKEKKEKRGSERIKKIECKGLKL